jgi:hypothetical protein
MLANFLTTIYTHLPETIYAAILGILGICMQNSGKKVKDFMIKYDALKNGTIAILRNNIIQLYHIYTEKGYIPVHALESVLAMYTEYKALGGNGTVSTLIEELKDLPHCKPNKEDNRNGKERED